MPGVTAGDVVAEKYRVERMLGSGGMGYVVAARHLSLDQLVAIKFLSRGALEDDEATARFKREAKAASRLKNEHVAKVYDVGVNESEEPFIVMEYLDGSDLGAVAKQRGALAISEAAEYVLQACEALAEAHSLGIIHRDVKLANLFLTRTASGWPLVKVLDFGVSKTIGKAEAQGDVTKTAAMLGSPKYMSPEQMNDPRAVDARTDVWSLGVVLYRLVTGNAPFEGDTIGRLCTAVLHDHPPPVNALRPDAPAQFAAVVARCLEKDRTRRFANVAELAAAIAPFCVEPERGHGAIERISSVLGVPPPPMGWMPSLPPVPIATPRSTPRGMEGSHAGWAASYGSNNVGAETASQRRPEILLAAAIASMAIVLGFVAFAMLRPPAKAAPVGAAPLTTATMTAAAPPVEFPPPVPAPTQLQAQAPSAPVVVPVAAAQTGVAPPAQAPRKTRPATTTTAKPAAPAAPASGSGELFPSDRK